MDSGSCFTRTICPFMESGNNDERAYVAARCWSALKSARPSTVPNGASASKGNREIADTDVFFARRRGKSSNEVIAHQPRSLGSFDPSAGTCSSLFAPDERKRGRQPDEAAIFERDTDLPSQGSFWIIWWSISNPEVVVTTFVAAACYTPKSYERPRETTFHCDGKLQEVSPANDGKMTGARSE